MATTRGFTNAARRGFEDRDLGPACEPFKSAPLLEHLHNPAIGVLFNYEAANYDTGDWTLTQASTGAAAISTEAPGVLEVDCNSTTQHQGVQLQHKTFFAMPASGKDLYFEAKFKVVDTFDKVELFVGLAEVDTTIIASGSISTANHLGFYIASAGAGAMTFAANKATAATTKTFTTIAEATYVKCGFKISGTTLVGAAYLNGTEVTGAAITATNIPVVALCPSVVCQSDGTNDPILHIQYIRVYQLR